MSQTIRTEKTEAAFLEALGECGNVTMACKLSKVGRSAVYKWRREDAAFAATWDEAQELGTDALEDEALRRAFNGTGRPVFYQGEECGEVREYSDSLMMFMLKARRPEKFKERSSTELTGKDGAALVPVLNVTIAGDQPGLARDAGPGTADGRE